MIYLIRHGKTNEHVTGTIQNPNSELHPDHLHLLDNVKIRVSQTNIDSIITSPYTRAIQTTQYIFPEKEYQVLEYIHEFKTPEILHGQSDEFRHNFWEVEHSQNRLDHNWKYDDTSESFNELISRVRKLYNFCKKSKKNLIIIGHGSFFMHFLGNHLFQKEYSMKIYLDFVKKQFELGNGGYYMFENRGNELLLQEIFRNK